MCICAFMQSATSQLSGFLCNQCLIFREEIVTAEVPADMEALVAEKRRELIEAVSEVDDQLAELFLADEPISSSVLEVIWC